MWLLHCSTQGCTNNCCFQDIGKIAGRTLFFLLFYSKVKWEEVPNESLWGIYNSNTCHSVYCQESVLVKLSQYNKFSSVEGRLIRRSKQFKVRVPGGAGNYGGSFK